MRRVTKATHACGATYLQVRAVTALACWEVHSRHAQSLHQQ